MTSFLKRTTNKKSQKGTNATPRTFPENSQTGQKNAKKNAAANLRQAQDMTWFLSRARPGSCQPLKRFSRSRLEEDQINAE
jgi:hypothetical protein